MLHLKQQKASIRLLLSSVIAVSLTSLSFIWFKCWLLFNPNFSLSAVFSGTFFCIFSNRQKPFLGQLNPKNAVRHSREREQQQESRLWQFLPCQKCHQWDGEYSLKHISEIHRLWEGTLCFSAPSQSVILPLYSIKMVCACIYVAYCDSVLIYF